MQLLTRGQKLRVFVTLLPVLFFWGGPAQSIEIESPWLTLEELEVKVTPAQNGKKRGLDTLKVWVKNSGEKSLVGPVRLLVTETSKTIVNGDGYTADGSVFIIVSDEADYTLLPGETSEKITIELEKNSSKQSHNKVLPEKGKHDNTHGNKGGKEDFQFEAVAQYNPPFMLQLLHTADMDGATGALTNVKNFSALLNYFRAGAEESTLTLSSGDNFIPGPRYAAAEDESMTALLGIPGVARGDIVMLNAMGFQASAIGNHDLDGGSAGLAAAITPESTEGAYYEGALFPYLSANLDFTTDTNLLDLTVAEGLPAVHIPSTLTGSTIIEVNGEYVGVVGATTPKLASITNIGDITITPEDSDDLVALAAKIQTTVDALTATGINKIILLAHMQQIGVEIQLAGLLHNVDIIIAGGSNTLLADHNDLLRDGDTAVDSCIPSDLGLTESSCTYPISLHSLTDEPVLVVNTDGDYKYLGRLVLGFDGNGLIVSSSLDTEVNGAYATDDTGLERFGSPEATSEVTAIADALSDVLATRDGNILGATSVYLEGRRSLVRTQETNLGNLSADANLWAAREVDATTTISLKNGGGIRDDIGYYEYPPGSVSNDDLVYYPPAANPTIGKEAGDISQFDLQGALRFNNGLCIVTVSAKELVEIIEHSVAATADGATPGQFPQVAGIRFSFDPSSAPYSRVMSLVVEMENDEEDIVVSGGTLQGDASRTFRMVTLDFLAGGGDSYPFPDLTLATSNYVDLRDVIEEELGELASETGNDANFAEPGTEQDALAEYLQKFYDPSLDASNTPYDKEETSAAQDERIQNLSERVDEVIHY